MNVHGISATSATVSWVPGDSNYEHIISVNNGEPRAARPGVYKLTLTGKYNNNNR